VVRCCAQRHAVDMGDSMLSPARPSAGAGAAAGAGAGAGGVAAPKSIAVDFTGCPVLADTGGALTESQFSPALTHNWSKRQKT
jgi:hypothetical protein